MGNNIHPFDELSLNWCWLKSLLSTPMEKVQVSPQLWLPSFFDPVSRFWLFPDSIVSSQLNWKILLFEGKNAKEPESF